MAQAPTRRQVERRAAVRRMLAATAHLDPEPPTGATIRVRCFRMTRDECERARRYLLTVLLGDPPGTRERPCEGFCYDLRDLLRTRHITLDGKGAALPVPLSPARWRWLEQHAPEEARQHARQPGLLEYPLLREELTMLLATMKDQPAVCSRPDACYLVPRAPTTGPPAGARPGPPADVLYDASPETRYCGAASALERPREPEAPVAADRRGGARALAEARRLATEDLRRIGADVAETRAVVEHGLRGDMALLMLDAGATPAQAAGYLLDEALQTFLCGGGGGGEGRGGAPASVSGGSD